MTNRQLDPYIREYRQYKRGRPLSEGIQMRISESDRQALGELAHHHGLSCSEMIRVLIFREARREGLITEEEVPAVEKPKAPLAKGKRKKTRSKKRSTMSSLAEILRSKPRPQPSERKKQPTTKDRSES